MIIPFLGLEIKRSKPKNKVLDPATYSSSDFWSDISNATSTDKGMKLAAVFRCIDILSDNISMLPWTAVDTKTHQKPDDPYMQQIWYLLNIKPNRNMTPAVFFKTLEQHRLNGNAYVDIIRDRIGVPRELDILDPDRVHPERLDNKNVIYKVTDKKGGIRKLLSDEALHFKNISQDGLIGNSVLSYASDSVASMSKQEQFNRDFYDSGGVLGGLLEYDTDLSTIITNVPKDHPNYGRTLRDVMRDSFEKHIAKSSRAAKIAVIDKGGKYHETRPISQKDMAFVESKETSIADIARFYGVPLFMLFTGKESYESNEQNNLAFVSGKLNPIVTGYEQELTIKLIPYEMQMNKVQVKANLNVLLRGDIAARTSHYKEMWGLGAYNINKILDLENQPSIGELGEMHFASKNYAKLEDFKAGTQEIKQNE